MRSVILKVSGSVQRCCAQHPHLLSRPIQVMEAYTHTSKKLSSRRKRSSEPRIVLPMKRLSEKKLSKKFVDNLPIRAIGGNGGDGRMGFASFFGNEWAGPDGGDGGNGGHVVITASHDISSLSHIPRVVKASSGVPGKHSCMHGKNATHTIYKVPLGTVVRDRETGELLSELTSENHSCILARGGAGGRGNHYYLSNETRAPAVAETGGQGETRELFIEMKIAAHVGLVGFPNAGKSTLLTVLSRAKPKIADYPFTTLNPHIGMVEYPDKTQVAVADIPGLIEGSHLNRGLGISFLRHIEKCACLLYVIDMSVKEPWTHLQQLQYELEQYMKHLSKRPHAIIANKVDLPETRIKAELLRAKVNLPVIEVSGKEGLHIDNLKDEVRRLYDLYANKSLIRRQSKDTSESDSSNDDR